MINLILRGICLILSCGEPFLSQFKTQSVSIIYIQVEGKLGQTQDRINDMSEGVSWNPDNFNLIFYPGLAINLKVEFIRLLEMIDKKIREGVKKPSLIILDPLYMCVQGDLCS